MNFRPSGSSIVKPSYEFVVFPLNSFDEERDSRCYNLFNHKILVYYLWQFINRKLYKFMKWIKDLLRLIFVNLIWSAKIPRN